MADSRYDYIIVGAGSAGCVLAAKLSATGASVCLIEAGGSDRRLWAKIPLGIGKMVNDPRVLWNAATEPDPGLQGRQIQWISGRILGGGSSVNGMLSVRGNPSRYDDWARSGCPGWSYEDMRPYFNQLEDCRFSSSESRGRGGPISITKVNPGVLGAAFIQSCGSAGLPVVDDYNATFAEGASEFQIATRNGLRSGTAVEYLRPAMRRHNLTVLKNTTVAKVVFEGRRAVGVQAHQDDDARVFRADKEIILSAGGIRSPQLLELSGIGDADVLQRYGIGVIKHLPGVGENLQDHLMVRMCYRCTAPITIHDYLSNRLRLAAEVIKYAGTRGGLLSCGSLMALAFAKSHPSLRFPDIRLQLGLSSGASRTANGEGGGLDPFSAFHIGGYATHPTSRGSIHISGRDAKQPPKIFANYLASEDDRAVAIQVLKLLRRIADQPALRNYIVEEIRPGTAVSSDDALLEYARESGETCWHPLGTCKMGNDAMSVVDHELRVHGVDGLRVIDASVFPFQMSSNTNIPTIALAERGADLVANRPLSR